MLPGARRSTCELGSSRFVVSGEDDVNYEPEVIFPKIVDIGCVT